VIAIVDSGGANLSSVVNALENLGQQSELTSDPDRIARSSKVLLPGVGAAEDAMSRLKSKGLDSCIKTLKQPVLGICLGMQLLFESSEEGSIPCLGIIPGRVKRLNPRSSASASDRRQSESRPPSKFPLNPTASPLTRRAGNVLPIPHMGWNQVVYEADHLSPLFKGINDGEFFYFVHSYSAEPGKWVTAHCDYGERVTAAIQQDNFFGVQFHPERSSKAGSRLLLNFLAL
jgi:glutamine amidotransferase